MKGITNKKVNYGKPEMKIDLKNNIYFPGEIVKGHIYLKSGNYLNKGVIIYTIYGQEKITRNNKYKIECNNSTKIFYSSLQYPGLIKYSILKGITIPFQIDLPSYILPSFEFSVITNNNNNYGYIKNYLQIEIPELNLVKQKFIIIRRPMIKFNSPLSFQNEINSKIFGLFNKGSPILKTSFDKNFYFFNEEIIIKINFNNNNSKFCIKCIKIKLIRNVVFKLKENNDDSKINDLIFSDKLFCKSININEKVDLNDKNKDIIFEEKIKIKEPESVFNKHSVDYLNLGLRDKSNLILFLPSFDSSLFKCEYLISIEGIYHTLFRINNIIINMPISVYHKIEGSNNKDNEFNLFNSNINLNEENNENYKNEEKKENNENEDKLFSKPGFNKKDNNNQKNKDKDIKKYNINKNAKKNIIEEEEVKTYRNDKEKEWNNNITNGQIIPELYKVGDIYEKNK